MLQNEFEVEDAEIAANPLEDIFEEEPPLLDVFISDANYLDQRDAHPSMIQRDFVRHFEQVLYPATYIQMVEAFGPEWAPVRPINELAAEWGKGGGKDYVCQIAFSRVANILLCLKDPQAYYGFSHQTIIHLMNVAINAPQAHGVFFKPLRTLLTHSPWFADKFESNDLPGPQAIVIRFKKQIELISGHSSAEGLEGKNLIAAVADEISGFPTIAQVEANRTGLAPAKTADGLLEMLRSSATTRFTETFKLAQISYPRFKGDAIEQAVAEGVADIAEMGADSTWYVSGPYRSWETNPRYDKFERIEVAGATAPVPNVPSILKDYRRNPAYARAKYEARPEYSENRYFANDAHINDAFAVGQEDRKISPLTMKYRWGVETGGTKTEYEYHTGEERKPGWQVDFETTRDLVPIAGALYAIHGDMAITGDRAGVSMCHVRTWEARDWESVGGGEMESRPVVKIDFATAFEADAAAVAPSGENIPREVQIRWYRKLISYLRKQGFNITLATFDNFQSVDTMQILEANGIETKRVSTVTNNACWETLRDVMYDGRLEGYWEPTLVHEVQRLTLLPNGKVDHPPGGSKDIADSVAAATAGAIELGGTEGEDPQRADEPFDMFGAQDAIGMEFMPVGFEGMDMRPPVAASSSSPW